MIGIDGCGWSVGVDPALGGAILHARHDGSDVLRPAPAGCADPLATACFPLVPYANRIAEGRFAFEGRDYRLPRNFGEHPHSLHGTGWQSPWSVAAHDTAAVTLRLDHAPDDRWPWRFSAEQRIAVDDSGLAIRLALTNRGASSMPAGLGLHPYFPARDGATLAFAAEGMWLAGPTQLPTTRVAADHFGDWSNGAPVPRDTLIDNAFDGWGGRATIGGTVLVADADVVHLYAPPGGDFLCVEPVSHLPDAVNRGGMPVLAPGETTTLTATIARRA